MNANETIGIGWIDSGRVHGAFMLGVLQTTMSSLKKPNPIISFYRNQGLFLDVSRDAVIKLWEKDSATDWLLWVDSDIIINSETLDMLIEKADKNVSPVVSGIYFTIDEFDREGMPFKINASVDPYTPVDLNSDTLVKPNWTGLGFTLVHKSVIKKIREHFGDNEPIHNISYTKNEIIAEDVQFFKKIKELNIPFYVYPKAIVKHIKSIGIDEKYFIYKKYGMKNDN